MDINKQVIWKGANTGMTSDLLETLDASGNGSKVLRKKYLD